MSVAKRRRQAAKQITKMKKAGQKISPVEINGQKIATTFWGSAWCGNLEAYSDYSNRLPRGRTYVRNGSVVDLHVSAGHVYARVSGSNLYSVAIEIEPLPQARWEKIKAQCAGQIGSLVELLQGGISQSVMEIVTRKGEGLFPSPHEISPSCSCPDWAIMCKHVAATLYGVGARLDHEPELLFTLRGVDPTELIEAAIDQPTRSQQTSKARVLETDTLSSLFGVDIDMDMESVSSDAAPTKPRPTQRARRAKKASAKKASAKKASAKKASAKKASAKKATSKKATSKKATSKKATSKKATSKKTG